MAYIAETSKLTKKYGSFTAVEDISLHIEEGDIYGMIGRNGAGKTTTLKMLGGLSTPTSGEIALFGKDDQTVRRENLFAQVGILIEEPGIIKEFSAYDNIRLKCKLYGLDSEKYVEQLIRLVGLREAAGRKAGKFSMGMKQRLGIALALVGEPKLVILDEPTNGLDPQGIVEIRNLIQTLNQEKGITFIISSHALGELERIANRYGIIHEGQLVDEISAEEMRNRSGGNLEEYYFSKTGGVVLD